VAACQGGRLVVHFINRKNAPPDFSTQTGTQPTEPENKGVEVRDVIFSNNSERGYWRDLKDKYLVAEVVVDAKNTNDLVRDDLRQLYCYLKPALGNWGFIACRGEPSDAIQRFNRTLFKNFGQSRGLSIVSSSDIKRMVSLKVQGKDLSEYLRRRMAEFLRSV
jgi:hypothetical protein